VLVRNFVRLSISSRIYQKDKPHPHRCRPTRNSSVCRSFTASCNLSADSESKPIHAIFRGPSGPVCFAILQTLLQQVLINSDVLEAESEEQHSFDENEAIDEGAPEGFWD
jgi:hypothetical protein